ncbi:MAG TPA: hypothetical protein VMW28_03995, partial [Pelolinea sp.]|nr:hypothetical protein [Pelolinea sp.]
MRNKHFLILSLIVSSVFLLALAGVPPADTDGEFPVLSQDPTPIPIGPSLIQPGTLPCDPTAV